MVTVGACKDTRASWGACILGATAVPTPPPVQTAEGRGRPRLGCELVTPHGGGVWAGTGRPPLPKVLGIPH